MRYEIHDASEVRKIQTPASIRHQERIATAQAALLELRDAGPNKALFVHLDEGETAYGTTRAFKEVARFAGFSIRMRTQDTQKQPDGRERPSVLAVLLTGKASA